MSPMVEPGLTKRVNIACGAAKRWRGPARITL
jgi:hypothetical protein